jgi:hypothetical protein
MMIAAASAYIVKNLRIAASKYPFEMLFRSFDSVAWRFTDKRNPYEIDMIKYMFGVLRGMNGRSE